MKKILLIRCAPIDIFINQASVLKKNKEFKVYILCQKNVSDLIKNNCNCEDILELENDIFDYRKIKHEDNYKTLYNMKFDYVCIPSFKNDFVGYLNVFLYASRICRKIILINRNGKIYCKNASFLNKAYANIYTKIMEYRMKKFSLFVRRIYSK